MKTQVALALAGLALLATPATAHIQHIMSKLDLSKRAEIAAYVARNGVG